MKRVGIRGLSKAKSARTRVTALVLNRAFASIKRGERTMCWCGGSLIEFAHHPSYQRCTECGAYVNIRPPLTDELSLLYSFDLFWHKRLRLHGHPTIEGRPSNDLADGRIDYWLQLMEQYGTSSGTVVEIGPGHGGFLAELKKREYDCVGVEPDPATCRWIEENMGVDMIPGLFPGVVVPMADTFVAFDVLEHSADPLAFMKEVARVTKPGGRILLQCPIDRYDFDPPFGERGFRQMFDDVEHLFIFTDESMRRLAARSDLDIISMSERLWLHHEICVLAKP